MGCPEFTTVIGVDAEHVKQLSLVWPTWSRHKPYLLKNPMVIFYDPLQVDFREARWATNHPDVRVVPWHPLEYEGGEGKWLNAQRYKMLAGHVYVPFEHVETDYWLKIDTDTVAFEGGEEINPDWFTGDPAIVSQPWGYTKPVDQMKTLDDWADRNKIKFSVPRLDIPFDPQGTKVRHSRIISWVGFFNKRLGIAAAHLAAKSCGYGKLPVRSQDGYHWYIATRSDWEIRRVDFRGYGWEHHSRMRNIKAAVDRSMQ